MARQRARGPQQRGRTDTTAAAPMAERDAAPPERWQRGSEAEMAEPFDGAGYRVQRSRSGVAQLREADKIGDGEVLAAVRFRRDFELGLAGAPDPERRGLGGAGGPDSFMAARLGALGAYREAVQAVGMLGEQVLIAFVVEGLSLRRVAEKIGRNHQDLGGVVAAVLVRLAEHYHEVDSRRRPARQRRVA